MESSEENEIVLTNSHGDDFRSNGSNLPFSMMQGCVFAHSSVIRKMYARTMILRMVELKMNEKETKKGKHTMRWYQTRAYTSQEGSNGTETKLTSLYFLVQ